jgi:hypothetical protein
LTQKPTTTDLALIEDMKEGLPELRKLMNDNAAETPTKPIAPLDSAPKRVWELDNDGDETETDTVPLDHVENTEPVEEDAPQAVFEAPDPLTPRKTPRHAGRVKTRIMGFGTEATANENMFERASDATDAPDMPYPVGWLVVTKGPGRGQHFPLQNFVSTIGRGDDQAVTLNFGDDTISRNNHAAIAYDDQLNACFLGYGGKANLVRLNGRPVLTTEQLSNGATIRVGETDLRFVELCGADFTWADEGQDRGSNGG